MTFLTLKPEPWPVREALRYRPGEVVRYQGELWTVVEIPKIRNRRKLRIVEGKIVEDELAHFLPGGEFYVPGVIVFPADLDQP